MLTDYIRSDSSFLWRQDTKTVLEILGDLSDPKGTVYRMFEMLHITTNKNVALMSQDSSFVLVVHQRAWSRKESSFLLRILSVCAQMVKSVFVVRKSLRCSLPHQVLHRLDEYIEVLRGELLGTKLSVETLDLIASVKARLIQETLRRAARCVCVRGTVTETSVRHS